MQLRTQFGTRKNPASSRQHGSRFAAPTATQEACIHHSQEIDGPALKSSVPKVNSETNPHAAPQRAATAGEPAAKPNRLLTVHEVAELLRVPVSWVYSRTRKRTIDRLPGYRIGKYWRFSETEILAWVKRQREVKHAA